MRRWMSVLRTPLGLAATAADRRRARCSPSSRRSLDRPTPTPSTPTTSSPGRRAEHWAGTDNLGRDIFFRVLVATRLSVELALAATAIAVVAGLLLGAARSCSAAASGRLVSAGDQHRGRVPGLLLALFFAVIFGVGATGAVLAIGFAGAPAFARLTQTLVASVAARDYVAAARVAGVGRVRILLRHVLPNIAEPLVVNATIGAGGALLAFAGLSFLGLGVQPPAYDWGRLLCDGIGSIYVNPAAALAPGIAVAGRRPGVQPVRRVRRHGPRRRRRRRGAAAADDEPRAAVDGAADGRPRRTPARQSDLVLDVRDLRVTFPGPQRPDPAGARRHASPCAAARRSASWGSRARASPSPRWRSPS